MTIKLGFVGVGKWAQKLHLAFLSEGGGSAAFDRGTVPRESTPGEKYGRAGPRYTAFGEYQPWRDMIADKELAALVLCAPPEVTTEVAVACAAAGKPVMATKPLMLERSVPIRAPFYVDYWRLWDENYLAFKSAVNRMMPDVQRVYCPFNGAGPHRSFPGLLDYGPHAVAFVRDLLSVYEFDSIGMKRYLERSGGEMVEFELLYENQKGLPIPCRIETGNGYAAGNRGLFAETKGGNLGWKETPIETEFSVTGIHKKCPKEEALRRMCRSFLNDVSEGFVTTEHLDLSCAVMRDLAEVRRLAEAKSNV